MIGNTGPLQSYSQWLFPCTHLPLTNVNLHEPRSIGILPTFLPPPLSFWILHVILPLHRDHPPCAHSRSRRSHRGPLLLRILAKKAHRQWPRLMADHIANEVQCEANKANHGSHDAHDEANRVSWCTRPRDGGQLRIVAYTQRHNTAMADRGLTGSTTGPADLGSPTMQTLGGLLDSGTRRPTMRLVMEFLARNSQADGIMATPHDEVIMAGHGRRRSTTEADA